jgi:hypothetical protein
MHMTLMHVISDLKVGITSRLYRLEATHYIGIMARGHEHSHNYNHNDILSIVFEATMS